ncbi:histidine kinase [Streptomyces platensis]|uniref:sensor histidine kinase n=1 Tax=Streptomyces platensis TaxID=58346 RepID=UPI003794F10F
MRRHVGTGLTGCAALIALPLTYGRWPAVPCGTAPALASAALLLWAVARWPRSRDRLARPLALAGGLSLMTTAAAGPPSAPWGSVWRLAEMATLLMLLAVVARWAPLRQAVTAAVVTGVAVATWTLPLIPEPSVLSLAGAAAFWTLPVLGAAVVGGYPRLVEHRRHRLVIETRRSQQLELAQDLHDFVAHDISGIVAQAQAARFVAESDPGQALPALERIERAGLNALASMDRTVRMLHEAHGNTLTRADTPTPPHARPAADAPTPAGAHQPPPAAQLPPASQSPPRPQAPQARNSPPAAPPTQQIPTLPAPPLDATPHPEPLPGVAQLPTLIARFTSAGATEARLAMPPATPETLSRETSSTAYRMVVEALTNVRRHAPGAARVEVTLTPATGDNPLGDNPTDNNRTGHPVVATLEIQVTNDAGAAPAPALRARRQRAGHGGRGLASLRARVQATGGTLTYGPYGGGWRVRAVLPQTHPLPPETT